MTTSQSLLRSPSPDIDRVLALLAAFGIDEVRYSLEGSGDSGDTELDGVHYADGRDEPGLPEVAIGFHADGKPFFIEHFLGDRAADAPDGDWVNNEGGYGTVIFRPMAEEPDDRVECEMTYRMEGDYGDEDPDDFDNDEPLDVVELDAAEITDQTNAQILVVGECGQ